MKNSITSLPDIRTDERFSDTLLGIISDLCEQNLRFTLGPLKFEARFQDHAQNEDRRIRALTRRRVQKALYQLERGSFVTVAQGGYTLTPKGWLRYAWNYSRSVKKAKKKKQNKRWYVVIFDFPEPLRRFRDSFRRTLYNFGFEQLQISVFVTHDPKAFEFISKIISQAELFDRVKLIVGERIL